MSGPIFSKIIALALPIIGTSMIQMAYNMVDMMWLGRVGSDSVAAVSAASYFVWIGCSLMLITRIGVEVGVSQSLGRKSHKDAGQYVTNGLMAAVMIATLYGLFSYIMGPQMISIFDFDKEVVFQDALSYLRIISVGGILYYCNPTISGIYNGKGDSFTPFVISSIGLGLNIILDPLFIFGWFGLPELGAQGAAYASVISQTVVLLSFIFWMKKKNGPFGEKSLDWTFAKDKMVSIFKIGTPVALQSMAFAAIAIIIGRMVTQWGDLPMAIQGSGAQIEALSWMTASGLSTALGNFVGQNYGAGKWDRIYKGFLVTIGISTVIGLIVTLAFYLFAETIFGAFIPEEEAIRLGGIYLRIIAVSQVFMCVEIATSGGFNGIGKTVPPSVVGIVFTFSRIPMAYFLSQGVLWGIEGVQGVWWAISITSILKGTILFTWFYFLMMKRPEIQATRPRFIRILPTRIRQQIFDRSCEE